MTEWTAELIEEKLKKHLPLFVAAWRKPLTDDSEKEINNTAVDMAVALWTIVEGHPEYGVKM